MGLLLRDEVKVGDIELGFFIIELVEEVRGVVEIFYVGCVV